MKAIIIITGVVLGIGLGLFKGINHPKPLFWRMFVLGMMSLLIVLTFMPPIAANFSTAKYLAKADDNYKGNVLVYIGGKSSFDNFSKQWKVSIYNGGLKEQLFVYEKELPKEIKEGNNLVLNLSYDHTQNGFKYNSTVSVNPLLTFPVVPGLEEQIRIMNFHVPVAWISVLAYLFSMIYAIMYMKSRNLDYDLKASAAAEIGTLFTILATVTGMVWAKLNWGSFWNWDPRETSIFILLLIYGAYFALRAAIDNEELKAKLSSVYSVIAFVTVPFFIFVLPRLLDGLHPGSDNDTTAGPVISGQENTLNFLQQITFSLGFASFSLLFFWLLNLRYRIKKLEFKIL